MSATLPFPMPLAEKYRPRVIGDFVGLDKPKRILSKFAANPYASVWLFVGQPQRNSCLLCLPVLFIAGHNRGLGGLVSGPRLFVPTASNVCLCRGHD